MFHVHIKMRVELLRRKRFQSPILLRGRIENEDVRRNGRGNDFFQIVSIAEIPGHRLHTPAIGAGGFQCLRQRGAVLSTVQDHVGASLRQSIRHRLADTAAGAGDECPFSF